MKKIFASDTAIKIYSVLIAVLLWVVVVYGQNPETEKVVKEVPITYSNAEALENEGLCVLNEGPLTVDLKLKGKRLLLSKIEKDNIYASVYFNETKRAGEYDLGINVKLPIDNVTITDKSIYMIKARVEQVKKSDVKVEVLNTGTPKDSQTMILVKSIPEEVSLWGPESVMARVSKVVASVDVGQVQNGEKIISNYKILDSNNVDISDNVNIRKSVTAVELYPDVLSIKQVPIEPEYTGSVASGYVLTQSSILPTTVSLAGKSEVLNGLSGVKLSAVDLTGLNKDTNKTVKLRLPEGVMLADGSDSIAVSLKIEPIDTATVQISSVAIENLPAQMKSTVEGTPIAVQISGAKSLLTEPGITASVDLNGAVEGRHYLPLTIKAKNGIEIVGKYSIWVEISQ